MISSNLFSDAVHAFEDFFGDLLINYVIIEGQSVVNSQVGSIVNYFVVSPMGRIPKVLFIIHEYDYKK